jgi:exodeoxyribonuclease VII large subunit
MPSLFDLPFEEPAPKPPPARTPARRIYSVSELTAAIRSLLEETWFEVWVEGEISNCRVWSGHLYFTLKDDRAQLKGFMFRSDLRYLRFKPEDGLHVVARGRLTVYDPRGEYQITCAHLEPKGLGALQLAFEQLKRKLQGEGLFDVARKRALPRLPRKIGVVTSLDGAALRDIVKVLRERYVNVHLVLRHARVQGEGAAAEIARAIGDLAQVDGVDVLIVGRGGGAIEDLWAFNEEIVARAIAACPVPVVSAVGHETDVTIADFVADVRAATPSNAAELVVERKDEFASRIARLAGRLRDAARREVLARRRRVDILEARPGIAGLPARLALRGRHVAERAHELTRALRVIQRSRSRRLAEVSLRLEVHDPRRRLATNATRLGGLDARLQRAQLTRRHRADRLLRELAARLDNLSPLAVLARGYAVCWNAERTAVIRDASPDLVGRTVRVTLARGELACTVDQTAESPEPTLRRP